MCEWSGARRLGVGMWKWGAVEVQTSLPGSTDGGW